MGAVVATTLLPLLKERMTGIYNNAFENICKNLLLVSAMRGNDIQNNAKEFSEYLTEKHNLYNVIVNTKRTAGSKKVKDEINKIYDSKIPYETSKKVRQLNEIESTINNFDFRFFKSLINSKIK